MKTFEQFVKEDGEGAVPANVSSGVASYESPLGTKKPTAKKRNEAEEFIPDSQASKIIPVTSRGV